MMEEVETENDSTPQTSKEELGHSVHSKRRRASNKTLVQHLRVFSLFKDPRSCYLEPRLRDLYFSLLQHKDLAIQKVGGMYFNLLF